MKPYNALLYIPLLFCCWQANSQVATIPITINGQNTMFVEAVLNKADTLTLNFDTGCRDLILTDDVLKNKFQNRLELYRKGYDLQIGDFKVTTEIYNAVLAGHGTDGRFGWNYFADKIVELDYDKSRMVIWNSLSEAKYDLSQYEKLSVVFFDHLPYIEATMVQNDKEHRAYFLFDTGYQRTAMLDNESLSEVGFPKMNEIKRVMMHGALNNEIPVITSDLQTLKIGKIVLKNVPVQQITGNKPIQNRNAHILGNEVLKRFNVIMDWKNSAVYLKTNHLFDVEYIETSGS